MNIDNNSKRLKTRSGAQNFQIIWNMHCRERKRSCSWRSSFACCSLSSQCPKVRTRSQSAILGLSKMWCIIFRCPNLSKHGSQGWSSVHCMNGWCRRLRSCAKNWRPFDLWKLGCLTGRELSDSVFFQCVVTRSGVYDVLGIWLMPIFGLIWIAVFVCPIWKLCKLLSQDRSNRTEVSHWSLNI